MGVVRPIVTPTVVPPASVSSTRGAPGPRPKAVRSDPGFSIVRSTLAPVRLVTMPFTCASSASAWMGAVSRQSPSVRASSMVRSGKRIVTCVTSAAATGRTRVPAASRAASGSSNHQR
jgi:hypothetical protein